MKPSEKTYWRGKGPNPKTICPECGMYMFTAYSFPQQKKTAIGLVCENGHFLPNFEGLNKLSD